jgi:hypothetical protein
MAMWKYLIREIKFYYTNQFNTFDIMPSLIYNKSKLSARYKPFFKYSFSVKEWNILEQPKPKVNNSEQNLLIRNETKKKHLINQVGKGF